MEGDSSAPHGRTKAFFETLSRVPLSSLRLSQAFFLNGQRLLMCCWHFGLDAHRSHSCLALAHPSTLLHVQLHFRNPEAHLLVATHVHTPERLRALNVMSRQQHAQPFTLALHGNGGWSFGVFCCCRFCVSLRAPFQEVRAPRRGRLSWKKLGRHSGTVVIRMPREGFKVLGVCCRASQKCFLPYQSLTFCLLGLSLQWPLTSHT